MWLAACISFLSVAVLLTFLQSSVEAAGAGRAFPIDSENYVTERFQTINPSIEWDSTNFLVDLAGHYANCRATDGLVQLSHQTPEGHSISGVVDSTAGMQSDVDAVNNYIRVVVDRWIGRHTYDSKIRNARVFGCSVRPVCTGRAVISCLFSPGYSSGDHDYQADQPMPPEGLTEQKALAFTPEQYDVAETVTGNKWDRSHLLENLSGAETHCEMIGTSSWPFNTVRTADEIHGLRLKGVYGVARNRANTDLAIEEILKNFKAELGFAVQLGCSIIPDCEVGNEMFAVVSCLYQF